MCKECNHPSEEHVLYNGWFHCIHIDGGSNGWWVENYDLCHCLLILPKGEKDGVITNRRT